MMNNVPLRSKSFSAVTKGNGISSAKMSEYHSALAVFSDATLTQAYDLILNDKSHVGDKDSTDIGSSSNSKSGANNNGDTNHSKLTALYNKCKTSAASIAQIEAMPGFADSISSTATNKRTHMMNSLLNSKSTSSLLPRSQLRRGPSGPLLKKSASIVNSSSLGNSAGHKTHHHYNNHHVMGAGRKMKQQQQQHHNTTASNSTSKNNVKDEKDTNDEAIPESALNFLAALNAKKSLISSQEQKIRKKDTPNSKKGKEQKKGKKSKHSNQSSESKDISFDEESSSSGITDDGNDSSDDEEGDSSDDEVFIARKEKSNAPVDIKPTRQTRSSGHNANDSKSDESRKGKKRQRTTRSNKPIKNDDIEIDDNSPSKKRLKGLTDVIYDVGEEVAVYFDQDGKWYAATIQEVTLNNEVGKDRTSDRAKRANRRRGSEKDINNGSGKNDGDEVKVLCYTIEYDNGEVQTNVPPEDVMDKLED